VVSHDSGAAPRLGCGLAGSRRFRRFGYAQIDSRDTGQTPDVQEPCSKQIPADVVPPMRGIYVHPPESHLVCGLCGFLTENPKHAYQLAGFGAEYD